MQLAAIGDIHGNLPALEAVLRDIDDAGIHTILNTGDAVVGFPWPNEVIALLRERDIPTVQGEMDRFAVRFTRKEQSFRDKWPNRDFETLRWTHENLRSEYIEWLRALPRKRAFEIEDIPIVLCHGTTSSQADQLDHDNPRERFEREREAANAQLVICGRTHRAYAKQIADTLFVNPGSVGMPPDDGPFASYALIDTDSTPWRVDHRRPRYDIDLINTRLRECGLDRP